MQINEHRAPQSEEKEFSDKLTHPLFHKHKEYDAKDIADAVINLRDALQAVDPSERLFTSESSPVLVDAVKRIGRLAVKYINETGDWRAILSAMKHITIDTMIVRLPNCITETM